MNKVIPAGGVGIVIVAQVDAITPFVIRAVEKAVGVAAAYAQVTVVAAAGAEFGLASDRQSGAGRDCVHREGSVYGYTVVKRVLPCKGLIMIEQRHVGRKTRVGQCA